MDIENTETLNLPCKMTKDEIVDCSKNLSEIIREIKELEEEKKATNKEYGESIEARKIKVLYLSGLIKTETLMKNVVCAWDFNFEAGLKTLTRTDTGEVISVLPLTIEDRQKPLNFTIEHKEFAVQS